MASRDLEGSAEENTCGFPSGATPDGGYRGLRAADDVTLHSRLIRTHYTTHYRHGNWCNPTYAYKITQEQLSTR